jgi:hypothetical protein
VDWKAHLIRLGWGGFQINQALFGEAATGIGKTRLYHAGYRSRFFVENVFEELDSPGEWYLDRRRGDLYAIPEAGVDLESALIEVPLLSTPVEFRGSQRQPVHDIHLSGFRIAHTESTFLKRYEAPSRGDWTIHRKGAVFLEGTKNCAIERCFFDAVGGNAVFLNQYNLDNRVYGNRITESGDSAICLVGSGAEIQGTSRPIPEKNLISNNLIHDCGYSARGYQDHRGRAVAAQTEGDTAQAEEASASRSGERHEASCPGDQSQNPQPDECSVQPCHPLGVHRPEPDHRAGARLRRKAGQQAGAHSRDP